MKTIFKISAWILILLGLILNEWVLSYLFSPDGSVASSKLWAIRVFDIVIIFIGIFLLRKKDISLPSRANLLLLIFSTLISFLIAELFSRYYLLNKADKSTLVRYGTFSMIDPDVLKFASHPYLGYYPNPGYRNSLGNLHNSKGFRGSEIGPKKRYRIVCLGGSTTYGHGVENFRYTYPAQLQEYLRSKGFEVEVINAGVHSYDSYQTLINLEFRVLELEPDLIIVYHGVNDYETRMVYPTRYFTYDNMGKNNGINYPDNGLLNRSVVIRFILGIFDLQEIYYDLDNTFVKDHHIYREYYNQLYKGTYPSGIFLKKDIYKIYSENSSKPLANNYKNIIAIAKANNIEVMFASFAFCENYIQDLEPKKVNVNMIESSTEFFQKAINDNNEMIKAICDSNSAYFYNFNYDMKKDVRYWTDGVHNTSEGNALKASLFGEYIIYNLLKNHTSHEHP